LIPLLPLALLGAGGLAFYEYMRGRASLREDIDPATELPVGDLEAVVDTSLGWPYSYGKGSPGTPWSDGVNGVDCSGYVQMALVEIGYLDSSATDRSAAELADGSDPVALGDQQPGDIAYYPGHVMLVCGPPGEDGHSPVIGASGGTSSTHGDDPKAYVKVFDTGAYRGDFVTYMRLK